MGCDALIAFPGSEYQFWHLDVSKCPCTRRSYRGRLWYAQVTVGKREAMPVAVLAEAYHLEDVLWNYELVNPEAMSKTFSSAGLIAEGPHVSEVVLVLVLTVERSDVRVAWCGCDALM